MMPSNAPLALILCLLVRTCICKEIFVINSQDDEGANDDLVSVAVLYRNGDRSPIVSFPNDPYYNSSYWPEGYGQLLKKGILNQYELGEWLRNRYDNFLPAEYSPEDVAVYSTDVDRTLMSAQANLAGLYPPPDSQVWEEDFLWEPIPVHRLATYDPVLTMNGDCPQFEEWLKQLETTDFFQDLYARNTEFFSNLSRYTGMNVSSLPDVAVIYDVYNVYKSHNESFIPSWIDYSVHSQLPVLAGLQMEKPTFTENLTRLSAGPFFNHLINHFDDIVNNVTATKLLMLSAHESTLVTVLRGMGYSAFFTLQFSTIVIWELRKNSGGEHYVNVLGKGGDLDIVVKINITSCDFDCFFSDFKTNLDNVNVDPETWEKECKIEPPSSSSVQIISSWSLLAVLAVIQKIA